MALVTALLLIAILFITLQAPMVGVSAGHGLCRRDYGFVSFRHHVSQSRRVGTDRGRVVGFGAILSVLLGGFLVPLLCQTNSGDDPVTVD